MEEKIRSRGIHCSKEPRW